VKMKESVECFQKACGEEEQPEKGDSRLL
jgi:hypothetical protein